VCELVAQLTRSLVENAMAGVAAYPQNGFADEIIHQVPFKFTGKIDKLTFELGPLQLSDVEEKVAAHAWPQL
jgi:hypothetical protein